MPLLQHQPRSEPVEQRTAYRYSFMWPVSEPDPVLGSLATGASVSEPSRIELLELDIDTRITNLWRELEDFDALLDHSQVAAFMRAAYGQGYSDAHTEERHGSLCRDHGYRVPERRAA